jgi:hypothetical protein
VEAILATSTNGVRYFIDYLKTFTSLPGISFSPW